MRRVCSGGGGGGVGVGSGLAAITVRVGRVDGEGTESGCGGASRVWRHSFGRSCGTEVERAWGGSFFAKKAGKRAVIGRGSENAMRGRKWHHGQRPRARLQRGRRSVHRAARRQGGGQGRLTAPRLAAQR